MSCSLFDYKSYTKEKQSKDRIFMTVTLFVFGILGIPTVVSDSPLAWIIIFLILAFIFFIAIIFDLSS